MTDIPILKKPDTRRGAVTPIIIGPPGKPDEKEVWNLFSKGEFPLYGYLLYSTLDKDFIEFISEHAAWLHQVSGKSCLIGYFENPEKLGKNWMNYWQKELGEKFEEEYARFKALTPEDRDLSYLLADLFNIDIRNIPCFVFVKSPEDRQILCVPIIQNKEKYREYFDDLFTVTRRVAKIPQEDRYPAFKKKWRLFWAKYNLPEQIKGYNKEIQEWGSLITETKDSVLGIINPFTSFMSSFKAAVG